MFRPSLGVFFFIIYNLYKSITPFERSVFPKFWTFKKKWFNVISIYYINVARNDMSSRTVVVGLRTTSIHLRTTLQMFGSNGLCIIVRNTGEDFNLNYGRIKDWTFFWLRILLIFDSLHYRNCNRMEILILNCCLRKGVLTCSNGITVNFL